MKREIKFREYRGDGRWHYWGLMDEGKFVGPCSPNSKAYQFTGHKTIKGKELYEGDIVFVEEHEDTGDKRYYLVIVWIPEWSMFASLHLDEYNKFIKEGYKVLDEPLFWTYTLETSENDFHYAGNIHETPHLVNLAVGV